MTNHPNRASRASPMAATVRAAREAAGLTPEQAGALVHERGRRWTDFESGTARMHPAAWELFRLKTAPKLPAGTSGDFTPGQLREFDAATLARIARESSGQRDYHDPKPGETWYDRDTGCAVVVGSVFEGVVFARGCAHGVSLPLSAWADDFQRDPVAV